MASLNSHTIALKILDQVLEGSFPIDNTTLFYTNLGVGTNKDGEEVKTEVFFFGVGSDIYTVSMHENGGEVQHLEATDAWSVFPAKDNEEEEEVSYDEEED